MGGKVDRLTVLRKERPSKWPALKRPAKYYSLLVIVLTLQNLTASAPIKTSIMAMHFDL